MPGLDDGGTGWMMCKNCCPLMPPMPPPPDVGDDTRGPVVSTEGMPEDAEVMTDGEDDEDDEEQEEDGEKAEATGEAVADGGDGRGLLIDRSTGSVWVWNWSEESRSSGGSDLTLLSRRGTASISG